MAGGLGAVKRAGEAARLCAMRSTLALWLLLALASSCGNGGESSPWTELARGYAPASLPALAPWEGAGFTIEPAGEDQPPGAVWLGSMIERERWRPFGLPGVWVATRPVGNPDLHLRASAGIRASAGAVEFAYHPWSLDIADPSEVPVGSFSVVVDKLYLRLAEGEAPPERTHYQALVPRGEEEAGRWRLDFGRWVGEGVPCWTGEQVELELELQADSELLLSTASIAPVAHPSTGGPAEGRARFRVEWEGELLLEHEQAVPHAGRVERHRLSLPAQGGRGRLRLSVDGDPALAAFLSPVLAPVERGRPGERPFEDAPADLVLFLADTFRADNMAAYGGELELTPTLDAFAGGACLFRRSWSPAIWTLPSQASMLSGAYPHEHGAVRELDAVPRGVETLAEHLRARGYRTGAITDAGLVSRRNGFDQGFEWFDERFRQEFDETLDEVRAFLDADDGRPTFLFVQTYRAHRPYRVSAQTRAEHGARLGIEGEWEDVFGAVRHNELGWEEGEPMPDALRADIARLRAHYHGGVIDLDRGFGHFLDLIEERGLLEHGYLAFTSDHGEAFGEHDALWHKGGVWEEMLRVPFFVHGPGVSAEVVERAASLVDLPRTLCGLAGVEPARAWGGVDLFDVLDDRPALGFECPPEGEGAMAIVSGPHKLHMPALPQELSSDHLRCAFDLELDRGEQNALGAEEAWVGALLDRTRALASQALTQRYDSSAADLGHEDEEILKALGYHGY